MTLPLALPKDFRKPSCTPGSTPIVAGNAFLFGPDIRTPRTRKEEPTRWQGSLARLQFSC